MHFLKRREQRKMASWRPICVTFVLTSVSLFGIFAIHGSEVATGTIVSGHISMDTTWHLAGSPYVVMNDVVVDLGVTLTIEPGVNVRFDPPGTHDYLSIFVEGSLFSIGRTDLLINFTSNSMSPVSDWNAIQINATGVAYIENCSLSYGGGLTLVSSTSQIVLNNVFSSTAVVTTYSSSHIITNNTFLDRSGVFLSSGSNTFTGNLLSRSSIWVNANGNVVSGNFLSRGYGGTLRGIMVDSNSNVIANNTVREISGDAVRVRGSRNVISFNSIISSEFGIVFSVSYDNNTAYHNKVNDCGYGITILASDDNRILQNEIDGGTHGISVDGDRNLIVGNVVSAASSYGLRLRSSKENVVYHNVFLENAVQAQDDENSNSWDDGYPSGGNYWSDYTGNDSYQGPNQIIPGSDGIGDTAYPVNPNGTDKYPLMEPTISAAPPRNARAHLSGPNSENVTITWNLSWNDGHRANDVIAYEVYRSSNYDWRRVGYSVIGSAPNQINEFVDVYAGEGDPDNYFYYLCAVNGTTDQSCSVDQVGKYTKQLPEGKHLVSVPLAQSDERIGTVLQTVSFDKAWFYNSNGVEWESFAESKPYSKGLENLNHTIGFWINVTKDSNFTVAGRVIRELSIRLAPGWNLVGFPSFQSTSLADARKGTPIIRVERSDARIDPYRLIAMKDTDPFLPGEGYWFLSSTEGFITFGN